MRPDPFGGALLNRIQQQAGPAAPGAVGEQLTALIEQVSELTAYGTSLREGDATGPRNAVLVASGSFDLRQQVEAALTEDMKTGLTQSVSDLPFLAFAIRDPQKLPFPGGSDLEAPANPPMLVAFPGGPRIALSRSAAQLRRLPLIGTKQQPSLREALPPAPLAGLPTLPAHAYFFASLVPPEANDSREPGLQSVLLTLSQRLTISASSDSRIARVHADLSARSPAAAARLADILRGFISASTVTSSRDQDAAALVGAITIEQKASTVSAGLEYPSEKLAAWLPGSVPRQPPGMLVATWDSSDDRSLENSQDGINAGAPINVVTHTVGNVHLEYGSAVTLAAMSNSPMGSSSLISIAPVSPAHGALQPGDIQGSPFRRKIRLIVGGTRPDPTDGPMERFLYPGPSGSYDITLRYPKGKKGVIHFWLWVRPPASTTPKP